MASHKQESFRAFDVVYSCADGKLTVLPTSATQQQLHQSSVIDVNPRLSAARDRRESAPIRVP
jgi:hypothetical protein